MPRRAVATVCASLRSLPRKRTFMNPHEVARTGCVSLSVGCGCGSTGGVVGGWRGRRRSRFRDGTADHAVAAPDYDAFSVFARLAAGRLLVSILPLIVAPSCTA